MAANAARRQQRRDHAGDVRAERKVRDMGRADVPLPIYAQMLALAQKAVEARTERIAIGHKPRSPALA